MASHDDRVTIRTMSRDEWPIHRRIRLAALRTNPEAFGATLERDGAFDEAEWRRRTHLRSWFAFVDGEPAGMVQLWFDRESKPVPEVVARSSRVPVVCAATDSLGGTVGGFPSDHLGDTP